MFEDSFCNVFFNGTIFNFFLTFMTIMINDRGMKTSAILPFDNQSMKFDCNQNIILYIVFAEVI